MYNTDIKDILAELNEDSSDELNDNGYNEEKYDNSDNDSNKNDSNYVINVINDEDEDGSEDDSEDEYSATNKNGFYEYEETVKSKQNSGIFPTPFKDNEYDEGFSPKTVMELRMREITQNILAKKDWEKKINNKEIQKKWRKELENDYTIKMIDYAIDELEYYSKLKDKQGYILATPIDGVYQSDDLVDKNTKIKLLGEIGELENKPDEELDWHPDSNLQVLDLIHQSLYCYISDLTATTEKEIDQKNNPMTSWIGMGQKRKEIKEINKIDSKFYSTKYQWLPSDFRVNTDGSVSIDSYINNLHPYQYKELYSSISNIFSKFVPLFEKTLGYILQPTNIITINMDNIYSLTGRNLQVIVKLANIILSPDNPEYTGGTWHIEGMLNENIVATGIYYYSSNNISESNLKFRQAIKDPDYEQNDDNGVRQIYNLNDDDHMNQFLGYVNTIEDRCLVFPNVYQHCLSGFKLDDPTKPGSRKILVFFLVDPTKPILSTSRVPPQQPDWLLSSLLSYNSFGSRFPSELVSLIVDYISPLNINLAKQHRLSLMKERKYLQKNTDQFFLRPFSLCEH